MMGRLTDRMGSEPILSVKRSLSIGTMLNFDSDCDGHGDGDGTCKQALINRMGSKSNLFVKRSITIDTQC